MPDAQLRNLSDLTHAERAAAELAIERVLALPHNRDWLDWERPELVQAAARSQGVRLTRDEIARLL